MSASAESRIAVMLAVFVAIALDWLAVIPTLAVFAVIASAWLVVIPTLAVLAEIALA